MTRTFACRDPEAAPSVGTSAECTTNVPSSHYRADRWLRVEVARGTVDAYPACGGFGSRTLRVYAGTSRTPALSADTSAVRVARLGGGDAGPKATGLSSFTPDLVDA